MAADVDNGGDVIVSPVVVLHDTDLSQDQKSPAGARYTGRARLARSKRNLVVQVAAGRPLQHLVWTDPADDAEGWHIARRARLDLHDVE